MSFLKTLFGEQQRTDTTGFLVFNYSAMDSYYGKQAFDAIYAGLRSSSGVCAFHDGDIFNCETVRELAKQSSVVRPSSPQSPLANLSGSFNFGAYFAAMWTDTNANFKKVHDALVAASVPGYLGYLTLPGKHEFQDVVHLFQEKLSLPASIALKNGAIIKGTSKYGVGSRSADDALFRAVWGDKVDDARKAIADGADVDCINPDDRSSTPIFDASEKGYLEIVKLLLSKGADPNARALFNITPLMLAARFGHIEVVRTLIAGGAEVNAQDRDGGTVLDNADEHPDIQRVLREAGAR